MSSSPPILSGLGEIAADYDAVICDVWGVVHDGARAYPAACDALLRFRKTRGPVVLLTNAPRPVADIKRQFEILGVPTDCYDGIVSSGMAARSDLARRAHNGTIRIFHLGPERDRGIFQGLDVDTGDAAHCDVVLCTGLFDDEVETPDDYDDVLADLRRRNLTLLCANPDRVVQRGGKLVYCAGALATAYETSGGHVVWYGKPFPPIYDLTMEHLRGAKRVLVIGDGLYTDIKGANAVRLDSLFIADGIHGEEIEPFTPAHLAKLFAQAGVAARATLRTLVW